MFVDTELDDVPKISQFRSLSFPSAPSTRCRGCFRAFSAVGSVFMGGGKRGGNVDKYNMARIQ